METCCRIASWYSVTKKRLCSKSIAISQNVSSTLTTLPDIWSGGARAIRFLYSYFQPKIYLQTVESPEKRLFITVVATHVNQYIF